IRATLRPPRRSKQAPMRTVDPHTSALACCLGLLVGCTASGEDVRPPIDSLFFPTGMAISPDESLLFIVNANSELRFDSGSVTVVDLNLVDQVINGWLTNRTPDADHCRESDGITPVQSGDPDFTETLDCPDERLFMKPSAGARVGNFATDVAVQ